MQNSARTALCKRQRLIGGTNSERPPLPETAFAWGDDDHCDDDKKLYQDNFAPYPPLRTNGPGP